MYISCLTLYARLVVQLYMLDLLRLHFYSCKADTIVKFTQLCSKFLPTALLKFACDLLALDRDISFRRLTSPV